MVVTSEISERYRSVTEQFTQRVEAVPEGAWENPSPCDGWVARDVVGHLVSLSPGLPRWLRRRRAARRAFGRPGPGRRVERRARLGSRRRSTTPRRPPASSTARLDG